MSNEVATAGQATQTLVIIGEQNLNRGQYAKIHAGYLAALAQSAKRNKLPDLKRFREVLSLGAAIIDLGNGVTMTEPVDLPVDFGRSLERMITVGKYNDSERDENITPVNFPIYGSGVVLFEVSLLKFDHNVNSNYVEEMAVGIDKSNSWATGRMEHVLAYGEKNPEEQLEYPIIGLGSVARVADGLYVPCLDRMDSERFLNLYCCGDDGWDSDVRFLVVRKKVTQASAS